MAGIQFLGEVGSTGVSTGPHKHLYVRDLTTGAYIDPATIRSVQQGLRIGKNRVPALIKDQAGKFQFNPAAGITLTSSYGPRSAPTKGASSFHQGEDWALPEGTPIYYEGGGKYTPKPNQGGYGNLATLITGDNKYEIGLGHMKSLAPASELPGTTTSSSIFSISPTGYDQAQKRTNELLEAFLTGVEYKKKQQEPKSLANQLAQGLLSSVLNPQLNSIGTPAPSPELSQEYMQAIFG